MTTGMELDESKQKHPNIRNVDELPPFTIDRGSRFGATVRRLAFPAGAQDIGATHYEVAPGRTAFPRHYHCGMEEGIFVLDGRGTLRIGERTIDVRAGDWVTLLPGPDHAHELVNTGDAPLRYLCISTQARADIVGYPDSGKIAASASPGNDFFAKAWVRGIFRADSSVDYYDGEDEG